MASGWGLEYSFNSTTRFQVPVAAAGVTSSRRIRFDRKVSGQKKWVSGPPVWQFHHLVLSTDQLSTINMWLGYLIGSAWLIFVSIFFIFFFLRSSGKLFCSLAWPLNPVRAGSSHSFGCGGYGHKWRTCTCIRTTLNVFVCSPVILIKMRNLFCVWVLGSTFRGVAGTAFTIYGNFIRVLVFRLSRFVFVAAIEVNKLAEGSG